uniref:ShKT domain-containing protein n=1 Tax=Ditylenchus dipsaci TaxID=166011 RepID=A0A915CXP0_9BILA
MAACNNHCLCGLKGKCFGMATQAQEKQFITQHCIKECEYMKGCEMATTTAPPPTTPAPSPPGCSDVITLCKNFTIRGCTPAGDPKCNLFCRNKNHTDAYKKLRCAATCKMC